MTNKKYYAIIDFLKNIIKDTIFENHVYSVGGCERDILLGNDIKDIDLVIDFIPNGGIKFAEYLYEKHYCYHLYLHLQRLLQLRLQVKKSRKKPCFRHFPLFHTPQKHK